MMSVETVSSVTLAEFEQFILENAERNYEYVAGEIVQGVSNQYASQIAARINGFLFMYLLQNDIGYLSGADGGFVIAGERYIPDVGYISRVRQPQPSHDTYNPNAPDLAVEVISPTDRADIVRVKVGNYLAAGTLVWLVNPDAKQVEVYAPGQPVQRLNVGDTLDGGAVLPGFVLPVRDVFPA